MRDRVSWRLTPFAEGSTALRVSMLQGVWVRLTWRRLARVVGLSYRDPTPPFRLWSWRRADPHDDEPHVVVPRIRITPDRYGVVVRARALPHVGREQWEDSCPSLAASPGAWHGSLLSTTRGRLVIRGVRRDPLTVPPRGHLRCQVGLTDSWSWPIGVDEFGLRCLSPAERGRRHRCRLPRLG